MFTKKIFLCTFVIAFILMFSMIVTNVNAVDTVKYPVMTQFLTEVTQVIKDNKDDPTKAATAMDTVIEKYSKDKATLETEAKALQSALETKLKGLCDKGKDAKKEKMDKKECKKMKEKVMSAITEEIPALQELLTLHSDKSYKKVLKAVKDKVNTFMPMGGNCCGGKCKGKCKDEEAKVKVKVK